MLIDIPPQEWKSFFSQFTQQHQNWLVTVGELPSGLAEGRELLETPGVRLIARELALQAIEVGERASASGAFVVHIVAGKPPERVMHRVAGARRIAVEQTETGAHRGLRIDGVGGTTLVRFRTAVVPETVDGLL